VTRDETKAGDTGPVLPHEAGGSPVLDCCAAVLKETLAWQVQQAKEK
jgi:hypothetical protein